MAKDRRGSDAQNATKRYQEGFDTAARLNQPHLAYYNGINLAYMKLAAEDNLEEARRLAEEVLGWIAESTRPDIPWKAATEGEAHAYLGSIDMALAKYREALSAEPRPKDWARVIASMYRQAKSIGHHLQSTAFSEGIEQLFRGSSGS